MSIQIEVISDVVCPWCYIGKRRLERALARLRETAGAPQVNVMWRPFQLNPELPEAGVDRAQYVQAKFGAAADQVYGRVRAVGRTVGIDFAFESIVRQPNTLAAHQLIAAASAEGCQDQVVEAFFRGYFLEGADLTQRATLVSLAQGGGMAADRAEACLDDRHQREAALDADRAARELGVEGVPFFVFDRRLAVSGAQEPEVLLQAIERTAQATSEVT